MTLFSDEDRRRWTREVLTRVGEEQRSEQRRSACAYTQPNGTGHTHRSLYDADTGQQSSSGGSSSSRCVGGQQGFDSGKESAVQSFQTWRQSLVQLRTVFPGGGNYSGVGAFLDPHDRGDGTGMCARLMEMRARQKDVMDSRRFREGEKEREEEDGAATEPVRQFPNLYAGNLKVQLSGSQLERDRDR
jgi:hypothetical protein